MFLTGAIMEKGRNMHVQSIPQKSELSLQRPENLIEVENSDGSVIIRAARDNFSERRKEFFIRYLAAEGFIPGDFEKYAIIWAIDLGWVEHGPVLVQRTNRFMLRLFISASLLWLALMSIAFLWSAH
jgi:hypothetical protein